MLKHTYFKKKLKKEKSFGRMIYVEFMRSILQLTRKRNQWHFARACTVNSLELGANEINHTHTHTCTNLCVESSAGNCSHIWTISRQVRPTHKIFDTSGFVGEKSSSMTSFSRKPVSGFDVMSTFYLTAENTRFFSTDTNPVWRFIQHMNVATAATSGHIRSGHVHASHCLWTLKLSDKRAQIFIHY